MRVSGQSDRAGRERAQGAETDRVTASEPREEHHGASVGGGNKEPCDTVKMPNKPKKEKVSRRLRAVGFHAGSRRGPEAAVILADEDFGCRFIELANLAS